MDGPGLTVELCCRVEWRLVLLSCLVLKQPECQLFDTVKVLKLLKIVLLRLRRFEPGLRQNASLKRLTRCFTPMFNIRIALSILTVVAGSCEEPP